LLVAPGVTRISTARDEGLAVDGPTWGGPGGGGGMMKGLPSASIALPGTIAFDNGKEGDQPPRWPSAESDSKAAACATNSAADADFSAADAAFAAASAEANAAWAAICKTEVRCEAAHEDGFDAGVWAIS